jgi:cell division protein YceG involved in septum cleavage
VKEARAQAEAADLGVQLTKAKVAGAVKTGYLRLERSRQLYQLARRMLSAARVVEASYQPDGQDLDPARAKLEAELFRADLEYRQAYAQVKNLITGQATGSAPNGEGISAVQGVTTDSRWRRTMRRIRRANSGSALARAGA